MKIHQLLPGMENITITGRVISKSEESEVEARYDTQIISCVL